MHKYVSGIQGERILLGWDVQREFKWMSEKCPSILKLFISWYDVQKLAAKGFENAKI